MKIVIAPDSFKGATSAQDLCQSIEKGVLRLFPEAIVQSIPMADGGEGTMVNMVSATNGVIVEREVHGPLHEKVKASYGILGDKETVVIEVAEASGLTLVREEDRNPLITTSYGTGELIKDALDSGYRRFIIGLGGSATNDAGYGILKALGMAFYDFNKKPLKDGGGSLGELEYLDTSKFDPRIAESTFLVACDVDNPLCGEKGASSIFGPQKGATKEMVKLLDYNLNHFADVISKQVGVETRNIPGGGAAGGIGVALITFFNAKLVSGVDLVMKEVAFDERITNADIIITGEGKLDRQTLSGKVIMGVANAAKKQGIPVIALCGQLALDRVEVQQLGLLGAFSILNKPCNLDEAFSHTSTWATQSIENILPVFFHQLT